MHINAGAAALGVILVIGKRNGFKRDPMRPHNLPLVMLGAGLLWFGWFGFNAGSWLGSDGVAAVAFTNTQVATAAAMLGWLIYERLRHGSFTTLGAASGAVSGLVAVTPACGSISPLGAIALGLVTGVICAAAVGLKYRFNYDDSLDVVGVHMVGGIVGSLSIGFLATGGVGQTAKGLFYGGGLHQLGLQFIGVGAVLGYSLVCRRDPRQDHRHDHGLPGHRRRGGHRHRPGAARRDRLRLHRRRLPQRRDAATGSGADASSSKKVDA